MNIIPEFLGDLCMKGEQLLQSNSAWQKKTKYLGFIYLLSNM